MPANLSPGYIAAERAYKEAKTKEEKLIHLEEMLSNIPKHKGTEKMQADIKRRISQVRKTVETKKGKKGISHRVHPEGAGQIILLGPPNSGKSQLISTLTHAESKVDAYPFTTVEPHPGMMEYKKTHFQLVDMPPITPEHAEFFIFDNLRGSDGALLVADGGAPDPLEGIENVLQAIRHHKILPVHIEEGKGIGEEGWMKKPLIIAYNKIDLPQAKDNLSVVKELFEEDFELYPISANEPSTLEELKAKLFQSLHVIRVFTKAPHKDPDLDSPFTVPAGTNLKEFAEHVHKDLAETFKGGRIWGSSKFEGQQVKMDFILQDGDIVELII